MIVWLKRFYDVLFLEKQTYCHKCQCCFCIHPIQSQTRQQWNQRLQVLRSNMQTCSPPHHPWSQDQSTTGLALGARPSTYPPLASGNEGICHDLSLLNAPSGLCSPFPLFFWKQISTLRSRAGVSLESRGELEGEGMLWVSENEVQQNGKPFYKELTCITSYLSDGYVLQMFRIGCGQEMFSRVGKFCYQETCSNRRNFGATDGTNPFCPWWTAAQVIVEIFPIHALSGELPHSLWWLLPK